MSTILIDTHVLLWAAADDHRLTESARNTLRGSDVLVSAASAYEIALKTRLGRLPGGSAVLDGWSRLLRGLKAQELSLTVAHMRRAGELTWTHRDPFDRMLVAQAQLEGVALLTDDTAVSSYADVRTIGL